MLLGAFRGGNPLGRIVGKPEKCPRQRAMQLKKCRTSRLRAILAIASFIAAFPTSHIMSEKPIFGVPVFRSGEQRGVHTGACQTSPGHRSSAAKAIPCADLNEVKACPALAAPERVVLDRRRLAPQDSNRERPVNALKSKLNLGQQLARAADYKANDLG